MAIGYWLLAILLKDARILRNSLGVVVKIPTMRSISKKTVGE
jgi:hypothetical protein